MDERIELEIKDREFRTEQELYYEIGNLLEIDYGMTEAPFEQLIIVGKQWFQNNLSAIREVLCSDAARKAFETYKDQSQLAIALANLMLGLHNMFPVAQVVWLVLKIGLADFCQWNHEVVTSRDKT